MPFCQIESATLSPDGRVVAIAYSPPRVNLTEAELLSYQDYFRKRDPTFFDAKQGKCFPDGVLCFYDTETGNELRRFSSSSNVYEIAYSVDGSSIAMSVWEGVRIIDATSGLTIAEYLSEDWSCKLLVHSANGDKLACVAGSEISVLDLSAVDEVGKLQHERTETIEDNLYFSPESTGSMEVVRGSVSVPTKSMLKFRSQNWQSKFGEFRPSSSCDYEGEFALCFSADSKQVGMSTCRMFSSEGVTSGGLFIGNVDGQGAERFIKSPDGQWLRTIAFSPDSRFVAAAGDQQQIFIWDLSDSKRCRSIGEPPAAVTCLQLNSKNRTVVAGYLDGSLAVIDVVDQRIQKSILTNSESIVFMDLCPEHGMLVVVNSNAGIQIREASNLSVQLEFDSGGQHCFGAAISSDGKTLNGIVQSNSGEIECVVWDVRDGQRIRSRVHLLEKVNHVFFAHTRAGHGLMFATRDSVYQIDPKTGTEIRRIFHRSKSGMSRLAFSPDGTKLVFASEYHQMMVHEWRNPNASMKESMFSIISTRDGPADICCSPDGKYLARSASYLPEIEIFDLKTGDLIRLLKRNLNRVNSLQFLTDSQTLVSGGEDGTIRFWDIANSKQQQSLMLEHRA